MSNSTFAENFSQGDIRVALFDQVGLVSSEIAEYLDWSLTKSSAMIIKTNYNYKLALFCLEIFIWKT